jgi:hypothetical protein
VLIIVILATSALGLLTNASSAANIVLSGRHSGSDIKSHCDANGGSFSTYKDGYSCYGSGGSIHCNTKGKCVGTCDNCAARKGPTSVAGVLQPSRGGVKTEGNPPPKDKGGLKPVSGGNKSNGGNQGGMQQSKDGKK